MTAGETARNHWPSLNGPVPTGAVAASAAQHDLTAGRAHGLDRLHGVLDHVDQDLLELHRVALDRGKVGLDLLAPGDAVRLAAVAEQQADLGGDLSETDPLVTGKKPLPVVDSSDTEEGAHTAGYGLNQP